jgi:hypothetical protein
MLTGMGGEWEGGGERANVWQSTSIAVFSTHTLHTEAGNFFASTSIEASAMSVFAGTSDPLESKLVQLIGFSSSGQKMIGDATTSGTFLFDVSTQSGFSAVFMADTPGGNQPGVCYFTRLSGDFNGIGESATITNSGGTWKLAVVAGNGKVYAQARCMAFFQR